MEPAVPDGVFVVQAVFDLTSRAGLLVVGHATGPVRAGTRFADATGAVVTVIGVELLTPRNSLDGTLTILVQRGDSADLRPGSMLSRQSDPG